jgi:hypothetical protein
LKDFFFDFELCSFPYLISKKNLLSKKENSEPQHVLCLASRLLNSFLIFNLRDIQVDTPTIKITKKNDDKGYKLVLY